MSDYHIRHGIPQEIRGEYGSLLRIELWRSRRRRQAVYIQSLRVIFLIYGFAKKPTAQQLARGNRQLIYY